MDSYAAACDRITADMQHATTLDFPAYVAYLAHYGVTIARLASGMPVPESAVPALRAHADHVLAELNR